MKYNRFFRTLAVAVVLSLLMFAVPATPALAAVETLEVFPINGEVGDNVGVIGNDFYQGLTVYIYFSSQYAKAGDFIDDDVTAYEKVRTVTAGPEGYFNTYFVDGVPDRLTDGDDRETVHSGYYYVYAADSDDEILATAEFTVRGAELDPTEGPVGTEVEIDGIGFQENRGIVVEYDGAGVDIVSGDEKTDDYGEFSSTIIIPESTAGDHTIRVRAYYIVEIEFTVEPTLDISQTSGVVGDEVTAIGTGFGYNKSVTITFSGIEVATDETNEDGSFETAFEVPEVGPGTYEVKARDKSNNEGSTAFTITTNLAISPVTTADSPGHVGQSVTVSGAGFKPSWQITVTYASTPVVFNTTSLEDGSFSYTFEVPPSEAGPHTITATDGVSTPMQVVFFMESTPPGIPLPLLPLVDEKAEPEAYFDWESVTDDSGPVTYDLQVATDADFTNILVNKTELTTSEYTLTEGEKLESTSEEEPYYWRVGAVDAASNASDWSDAGTFYVGFSFHMQSWLLYTLIGIGVIVVFFLGFWLGRRTIPEDYYY